MAEINIEKKSSPIWPWILLIVLIVAGLIWYFSEDGEPIGDNYDQEQYQDTLHYENDMNDENNLNE